MSAWLQKAKAKLKCEWHLATYGMWLGHIRVTTYKKGDTIRIAIGKGSLKNGTLKIIRVFWTKED